ncbi:MAG: dihydrofolate reductase [Pseudonocardiales bacterium]|nr:dihydrofolate reductase [Pseudonocardiales bacterium]
MRQLVYFVAVSLDGKIGGPDGSFDFFPVDAGYLGELNEDWGDGLPTAFHRATGLEPPGTKWDTVVMGRNTFQPAIDAGISSPYEHLDQYVFSSSLDPAQHPDVHVVSGDPLAFVHSLKRQPGGDIWLCGGGTIAATLAPEIDRLVLKLSPFVVGEGVPLFAGPFAPSHWRLTHQRTHDIGVVVLTYDRAEAGS